MGEKKPYPRGILGTTDMESVQIAAMKSVLAAKTPKVLVVDVGGTNIKMLATGQKEPRKIPSGPTMTAGKMVRVVKECVKVCQRRVQPAQAGAGDAVTAG